MRRLSLRLELADAHVLGPGLLVAPELLLRLFGSDDEGIAGKTVEKCPGLVARRYLVEPFIELVDDRYGGRSRHHRGPPQAHARAWNSGFDHRRKVRCRIEPALARYCQYP